MLQCERDDFVNLLPPPAEIINQSSLVIDQTQHLTRTFRDVKAHQALEPFLKLSVIACAIATPRSILSLVPDLIHEQGFA